MRFEKFRDDEFADTRSDQREHKLKELAAAEIARKIPPGTLHRELPPALTDKLDRR